MLWTCYLNPAWTEIQFLKTCQWQTSQRRPIKDPQEAQYIPVSKQSAGSWGITSYELYSVKNYRAIYLIIDLIIFFYQWPSQVNLSGTHLPLMQGGMNIFTPPLSLNNKGF